MEAEIRNLGLQELHLVGIRVHTDPIIPRFEMKNVMCEFPQGLDVSHELASMKSRDKKGPT